MKLKFADEFEKFNKDSAQLKDTIARQQDANLMAIKSALDSSKRELR